MAVEGHCNVGAPVFFSTIGLRWERAGIAGDWWSMGRNVLIPLFSFANYNSPCESRTKQAQTGSFRSLRRAAELARAAALQREDFLRSRDYKHVAPLVRNGKGRQPGKRTPHVVPYKGGSSNR